MYAFFRHLAVLMLATASLCSCIPDETTLLEPAASAGSIHVTVGADIGDNAQTKSAIVPDGDFRDLTFTAGDKLYVRGTIDCTGPEKIVAGYLTLVSMSEDGFQASFSGDLNVYQLVSAVYTPSSFAFQDPDDPLAECFSSGMLVHKDAVGFTIDAGLNGSYDIRVAATVDELMTRSLPASGYYEDLNKFFRLSSYSVSTACTPIFNCTISGLAPGATYQLSYLNGDNSGSIDFTQTLGTVHAEAGTTPFACYVFETTREETYHALRLVNTSDALDILLVELGTKALSNKVYNLTRTTTLDAKYVPLAVEAQNDGTTISVLNRAKKANGTDGSMRYSVNGETTQTIGYGEAVDIPVNAGDIVSFWGDNATYDGSSITFNKVCCVFGNIMSLIRSMDFATATTLTGDYTFRSLFRPATPNAYLTILPAKPLLLPATNLTPGCYQELFQDCGGLTVAPALPALSLASSCYAHMFEGCTGLTETPSLPATALAESCYDSMFSNCTSLYTTSDLFALTLASGCYKAMFQGCSSLTESPILFAETLHQGCYESMFENCTRLCRVHCLSTDNTADDCTLNWLHNAGTDNSVTSRTFIGPASTVWSSDDSGIPAIWTKMSNVIDLSSIDNGQITVESGMTITGSFGGSGKGYVIIADGATVSLDGVNITAPASCDHAAVHCQGDACITIVKPSVVTAGEGSAWPAVYVPERHTLTLSGKSITAYGNDGSGAGIGGGYDTTNDRPIDCGNIVIDCGVEAHGGNFAAGIGSGKRGKCGNITFNSGLIESYGGEAGAGLGCGDYGECRDILFNGGDCHFYGGEHASGIDVYSSSKMTVGAGITLISATKGANGSYCIKASRSQLFLDEGLEDTGEPIGGPRIIRPQFR